MRLFRNRPLGCVSIISHPTHLNSSIVGWRISKTVSRKDAKARKARKRTGAGTPNGVRLVSRGCFAMIRALCEDSRSRS